MDASLFFKTQKHDQNVISEAKMLKESQFSPSAATETVLGSALIHARISS